jgi:hypothetical protein
MAILQDFIEHGLDLWEVQKLAAPGGHMTVKLICDTRDLYRMF